jgi:hypothetical protein
LKLVWYFRGKKIIMKNNHEPQLSKAMCVVWVLLVSI